MKRTAIKTGLESLYFSGAHLFMRPFVSGMGAILTLHQVRPPRPGRFQPNRALEVDPRFLERAVRTLRRSDLDLISLDEMYERLTRDQPCDRRFVCLTFDDGYRDTLETAYPILKKYEVPFTLFLPTSFPDQIGEMWWLALEAVIARNDRIGLMIGERERYFDCATVADKWHLWNEIYGYLRSLPTEEAMRSAVRDLSARYDVDVGGFCRELCMTWEEVAQLAADPLVTIGSHTVNHVILSKVSHQEMRSEMENSRAVIEASLGVRPQHLAYPMGDRSSAGPREFDTAAFLGFKTAVTTRPGLVFRAHREHLTALPRISLNGDYQHVRYLQVLLSGAATAISSGFRHVDAA